MSIHEAFATIFKSCKPSSQKALADQAGVNPGQFSHWLKQGTDLGDEKIAALIEALLAALAKEPNHACKQRHAGEIERILAFPAYAATLAHAFPLQPVPATHPTYIKRDTEDRLLAQFDNSTVDIAVVGGVKMGKTSLLNWLQQALRGKRHQVLRIDFRERPAAPLATIVDAATHAGLKGARPRHWEGFADWARRTLLADARPCTLLLDHIQELPDAALAALQDGIHGLINKRREEPMLAKLHLVMAYDEAAPAMRNARDHASGMIRNIRGHALGLLGEDQVENLLTPILQIQAPNALDSYVATAWEHFRGHPFLTHLWADALAGQKGHYDPKSALAVITPEADRLLFQPFACGLDEATRKLLHAAAQDIAENFAAPPSALVRLWLYDSGLFRKDETDGHSHIEFASPWIHERLKAALNTAP